MNKSKLAALMLFMHSKYATLFTMATFFYLRTLVNNSSSKVTRTQFFSFIPLVAGARMTTFLLDLA